MSPQLSVQIINVDAPLAIDLHADPLGELVEACRRTVVRASPTRMSGGFYYREPRPAGDGCRLR